MMDADRLKRFLRELKKKEVRMTCGLLGVECVSMSYVWDSFFDLKKPYKKGARYTLDELLFMSDEEFEEVVDEYFFEIVDRLNYHVQHVLHPVLKLPINSDMETVKKKFRELAKEMHPDTGGSIEEFLALYEAYELFKRKRY